MTRLVAILVSTFSVIVAFPTWADPKRPNVVLILADDLGFSDIAPYGSEIATPSITALAEGGVRFTNYHTAASCAPSRAMLLTGVDSHRAGVPNIPEMLPPEHSERSGSKGTLGRNVVTVATLLQDAGYHTYIAGKWHLGMTPDLLPSQRGFEKTFVLADSGADNWEQKPYLPIYDKANWFADGEEAELPEDFYSSRFLVDKTMEFIDSQVDIVFANEAEVCALFETQDFDDAVNALAARTAIAAVTRSEKGSVVVAGEARHEIWAAAVDKVVDTTGAGDHYAAGFLYGLAHDRSLPVCGQLGALAAAEVISHYGPRPQVSLKDLAASRGL